MVHRPNSWSSECCLRSLTQRPAGGCGPSFAAAAASNVERPRTRRGLLRGLALVAALGVATLGWAADARAAVEWHPDLETARAASRISHRPVLAVFVAEWSGGANDIERSCLGSAEAAAVLATCFEPVRIDIDHHPDLTRSAGVSRVPTACVLGAGDAPLATFEMPESPTAFVTAAILAAQQAAAADHGTVAADVSLPASQRPPEPTPGPPAAAFGASPDPAAVTGRPARGSMARVSAKVRELSAFAMGQGRPAVVAAPVAIAQALRDKAATVPGSAPPAWPAEHATAMPTTPPPAPTTIEPSAIASSNVAPWLGAPPARGTTTAAQPASPTMAGTPIQASPLPDTAPPQPASQPSGLIAALQKPFAFFGKGPTAPPTMPPARPTDPLAAASTSAAEAPADGDRSDAYGSMPLGLEGYCPVTLVDRSSWAEGRAQWGARHRGRTYLFAGPDEQRTFLANPDRYAPALSGDDPVLALDRGSSTPGQRRYGVTYESRMYLFATPETRAAFTADPGRYAARILVAERVAPAGGSRIY